VKPQVARCAAASVAVQVTGVVPTGNAVPLAGEQVTAIGAVPPKATGVANVTGTAAPPTVVVSTLAGQVTLTADGRGGGLVGVLPHPAHTHAVSAIAAHRPRRRKGSMIGAKAT
jgi:hypothetical protein